MNLMPHKIPPSPPLEKGGAFESPPLSKGDLGGFRGIFVEPTPLVNSIGGGGMH